MADIYGKLGRHEESLAYDRKALESIYFKYLGCMANTMRRLAQCG